MIHWNKLLLGKQAKELGFVRDTCEKVCRLTESDEILERIKIHPMALWKCSQK